MTNIVWCIDVTRQSTVYFSWDVWQCDSFIDGTSACVLFVFNLNVPIVDKSQSFDKRDFADRPEAWFSEGVVSRFQRSLDFNSELSVVQVYVLVLDFLTTISLFLSRWAIRICTFVTQTALRLSFVIVLLHLQSKARRFSCPSSSCWYEHSVKSFSILHFSYHTTIYVAVIIFMKGRADALITT